MYRLRFDVPAALVPAALLLALLLAVAATGGRPLGPDSAAAGLVAASALASLLGQLGSGAVLYPVLVVAAGLQVLRGLDPRRAGLPLLALAIGQAVTTVAFAALSRPGPDGGPVSLLSGHAMTAALGWGLVAREVGGRACAGLAVAVAGVAGLARVALDQHWLSGVVAGWLLGLLLLAVADGLLGRVSPPEPRFAVSPAAPAPAGRVRIWLTTSPWAWALPAIASLLPLLPILLTPGPERMKDLLVYVGAGSSAGAATDVYEFRSLYDAAFVYPPFAALLSEPLSRVPLGLLQVLWVAATLAALVGVARVAMRPVVLRLGLPLTLALLLLSSPVRNHLRFGQVGLFLVLLVAVDLLHDSRRQGAGLGLAIAVKLTPAVFLPWLLVLGKTRTLRIAVATAAGATVAGSVLLWPSAEAYVRRALWNTDRFLPGDVTGNQSVRGMLLRSALSDDAAQQVWLAVALVLAVVGTLGARRLEHAGQRLGAVGVLAALSIAISPISWVHHLVFLAMPVAALVGAGRHRLAAAWAVVLTLSLPSLGTAGLRAGPGPDLLWQLVVDAQGLTAVAAVLLLPRLLRGVGSDHPRAGQLEPSPARVSS